MKSFKFPALALAFCVPVLAPAAQALTLNYTNVDPAGLADTTVGGVPARLILVTTDDLDLQADTSLTINVSFQNGQGLLVAPAAAPGNELVNLAFVSPSVNGASPIGASGPAGTVAVTAAGNFVPGSGTPLAFTPMFTPNSPLASADVLLLIRAGGNLTDSGYVLQSLQYQIDVPADFTTFPTTGINLLVSGSAFSVVPLPAALPLLLSALAGIGTFARRRAA